MATPVTAQRASAPAPRANVNPQPRNGNDQSGSIVVVSGDWGCGKTYWAISSPFGPVAVLDTEMSAEPYTILPWNKRFQFDWYPTLTFGGADGFQTTSQAIPAGKYGTIVVDTADQVWRWYVKVAEQRYPDPKSSGLKWGMAKDSMREWIMQMKTKCQWLILTTHMRLSWGDSGPLFQLANGKREKVKEPKAPEPIWELASLFFVLSRDPNTNDPPAAVTQKKRYPGIKPRIPRFTWAEMLKQMTMTPDEWGELAAEERIAEEKTMIEQVKELISLGVPASAIFPDADPDAE